MARLRRRAVVVLVAAVALAPSASTAPAAGPVDSSDLEAFVDGLMAAHFRTFELVGAVVAVVHDGEVTLSKGFGHASLETRTPVDPDRTLFRIGSITKLFTWTAVMQLVEQGAIDLHADVNDVLIDVRVPATYPEPVTMAHLMAHTAGFEDRSVGLFAHTPDAVRPLTELLGEGLPARVRPAGLIAAYSNHGAALAGLVVEDVSGLGWNDYLETFILSPLAMTRTTGVQPVPDALLPDHAVGYDAVDGAFVPRSFDYSPLAPAGSMSATAIDMTRFMVAHLQQGSLGDARILDADTARQMHDTLATHDPRLPGMAHGFIEQDSSGVRTIGHGGGIGSFHSLMVLVPEASFGVFVAYTTLGGAAAAADFVPAVLDFLLVGDAVPRAAPFAPTTSMSDPATLGGGYRPTRVAHTTLDRLAGLLQEATITVTSDGRLRATGLGSSGTTWWVRVEPNLYRAVGSDDLLVFRQDEHGNVVHGFVGSLPHLAYERLSWHDRAAFHVGIVAVAGLAFLSALTTWPVAALRSAGAPRTLAHAAAWVTSAFFLVFLVSLSVVLRDPMQIAYGIPPLLRVVLASGIVGSGLALLTVACAVTAWVRGAWSFGARVHYAIVALSAGAFVWFLHTWNLLGFRY